MVFCLSLSAGEMRGVVGMEVGRRQVLLAILHFFRVLGRDGGDEGEETLSRQSHLSPH